MIDWRELLFVLIRSGIRPTEIAETLEVHKSSVTNWLNYGVEPKGTRAVALAQWYRNVTNWAELPRT